MSEKVQYPSHAFGPRPVEQPKVVFDTEYKIISIVDKVVKVGEGDHDFIVDKEVIEEFKPIQEVVDVDKDSVGVYNIIKQVMRTGDTSLLPQDDGNCDVDFVNAPTDLMELKEMGVNAEASFKALPDVITEGRDMKSFVEMMSQEKFDALIKAIADRSSRKVEKKDE